MLAEKNLHIEHYSSSVLIVIFIRRISEKEFVWAISGNIYSQWKWIIYIIMKIHRTNDKCENRRLNKSLRYIFCFIFIFELIFLLIFIYFFVYVCVWNNIRKDRKIAQRIMFLLEQFKMKIKMRCFKYNTEKRKEIVIIWFLFAKKFELDLVRILIIFYTRMYI